MLREALDGRVVSIMMLGGMLLVACTNAGTYANEPMIEAAVAGKPEDLALFDLKLRSFVSSDEPLFCKVSINGSLTQCEHLHDQATTVLQSAKDLTYAFLSTHGQMHGKLVQALNVVPGVTVTLTSNASLAAKGYCSSLPQPCTLNYACTQFGCCSRTSTGTCSKCP
jgi:hypothetical protein